MAYQNVGTPRFYINELEWLASVDAIALPSELYRTLPVTPGAAGADNFTFPYNLQNPFLSMLGHWGWGSTGHYSVGTTIDNIVNGYGNPNYSGGFSLYYSPAYDGWSLVELDTTPNEFDANIMVGSIIIGSYYDMPHSPDLNLTMTREYGGIKHLETKGGASLSNAFYTKPPKWGDLGAWELSDVPLTPYSKSGRRIWDLSFSYLSNSDVFPEHSNLSDYETDGSAQPFIDGTILHSNDFYSQVIHKTNGGQLPFIFQPDGDGDTPGSGNNNPDQFAICKFDQQSFKFEQVANGVYNMKLKIRAVW